MAAAGIPDFAMVHACSIEPYAGTTGDGSEVFGAIVVVPRCLIDTGTKSLSRGVAAGGTGDEVRRPVSVYAPLDLDTSALVPRSRIRWDLGSGPQEARVDDVQRLDGGELPVPSHVLIKGS